MDATPDSLKPLYMEGELIFRTGSSKGNEFKLTLSSDGKHAGLKQSK